MRAAVVAIACLFALAACSGESDSGKPAAAAKPTKPPVAVEYGSVDELKDAAVTAGGYVCEAWVADNVVTLAAGSGHCDDESVFSTYASKADLQAQLDQDKVNDDMLLDAGLDTTPKLVGPNWIISAPEAPQMREDLGGVLVGAKTVD
jgi:hypothetical protein